MNGFRTALFFFAFFLFISSLEAKPTQVGAEAVEMYFKAQERFQIPSGEVFVVTKEVNAGEDRRVYAVIRESDGKRFVFKHARTRKIEKGRRGMEKEMKTVARLKEMNERHPPIAYSGADWLIRDWVEGELGLLWFERWKAAGYPESDPAWQSFYRLMERTASRGLFIGALDLDDIIIEADNEWNIIDSGRVRDLSSVDEAWEYYLDDLIYSWVEKLGNREVCAFLVQYAKPGRPKP